MPRKRFNAFEDFPAGEEQQPEQIHEQPAARAAGVPALFGGGISKDELAQVERIERLKPSQMMPDRFQPRRLLPTAIRQPFYSGQIDCYQAARQWLVMAKNDEGIRRQVDGLLAMGLSFEEHGQIKPITGSWVESPNGEFIFLIETGERRFWAACLQYAAHRLSEEPDLRVEVVPAPTRMRQVLENRHAEPPSAVGQACEVAALILAELGVQPENDLQDEYDYFRQWRARRMPTGMWEKITPVMQLTRERMVQILNILTLPNHLLDLADRYRVPERVLREVLRAPEAQRESLLINSIQKGLSSDDVAEIAGHAPPKSAERKAAPPDPVNQAINAVKRFAAAMDKLDEDTRSAVLDELANDLVLSDQAEEMIHLLRDLAERLRIRQQNRSRRR